MPAPVIVSNLPVCVIEVSVQSRRSNLDLLGEATAALVERLAERLVLDCVPPQADSEPETTASEEVDLRRLFGHERGLTLREDEDPGDELQRRGTGEIPEHHERFVERGRDVVRAVPTRMDPRVGANDVVVGEQMGVAEILGRLAVRADRANVSAELGLGEDHADPHRTPPSRCSSSRACRSAMMPT